MSDARRQPGSNGSGWEGPSGPCGPSRARRGSLGPQGLSGSERVLQARKAAVDPQRLLWALLSMSNLCAAAGGRSTLVPAAGWQPAPLLVARRMAVAAAARGGGVALFETGAPFLERSGTFETGAHFESATFSTLFPLLPTSDCQTWACELPGQRHESDWMMAHERTATIHGARASPPLSPPISIHHICFCGSGLVRATMDVLQHPDA